MLKIAIFVLNSSESWGKSVGYERVNRNTVHFKGSAAYNRQFNGSRDAYHILLGQFTLNCTTLNTPRSHIDIQLSCNILPCDIPIHMYTLC